SNRHYPRNQEREVSRADYLGYDKCVHEHVGNVEADQNGHEPLCSEEIGEVCSGNEEQTGERAQAAFTPSIIRSTILVLSERAPTSTDVIPAAESIRLARDAGS